MNTINKPMNRGFTLLEMLMSLFVFSLSISLLVASLPVFMRLQQIHIPIEEEMALHQVRDLLLLSSEITYSEHELQFFYLGKEVQLILEKGRLVRKDGYVIYMDHLFNSYFFKKGACIYLYYERNQQSNSRFLTCP